MKKKMTWLSVLVTLVAAFGLVFISCGGTNNNTGGGDKYKVINECPEADKAAKGGYLRIAPSDATAGGVVSGRSITITPVPNSGMEVAQVAILRADETDPEVLYADGGVYRFSMPKVDVTVQGSFKKEGEGEETGPELFADGDWAEGVGASYFTDWDEGQTTGNNPSGTITVVPNEGYRAGTAAAKLSFTNVGNNILVVEIRGFGADMAKYHALFLRAKAGGSFSGKDPGINSISFGTRKSGSEDDEWFELSKSVSYVPGEAGAFFELDTTYKSFTIPIPTPLTGVADTVQLIFGKRQVEGVDIYLDDIYFFTDNTGRAELIEIALPESATIPFKDNAGTVQQVQLDILTMETKLTYAFKGGQYNFFGENPDYNVTDFQNKFTDWYSTISYTASSDFTVTGNTIQANNYGATGTVNVTYGSGSGAKSSTIPMSITALGNQTVATSNTRIDDFDKMTQQFWNNDPLPFFTGGTAGDAQNYQYANEGHMVIHCADLRTDRVLDDGTDAANWIVVGYTGLNHDLSSISQVVIEMGGIPIGGNWVFSLTSGWAGVTGNSEKSSSVTMVGKGASKQEYTFNKGDFDGNVDWKNITGYSFSCDRSLYSTEATWITPLQLGPITVK